MSSDQPLLKLDDIKHSIGELDAPDKVKAQICGLVFSTCIQVDQANIPKENASPIQMIEKSVTNIKKYKEFLTLADQYDPDGNYKAFIR